MDGGHLDRLPPGSMLARLDGPGWQYGQPYEIMVVVVPVDEDTCQIRGLDKHPTIEHLRILGQLLKAEDYRFLEFERRIDGRLTHHCHPLR
jgi:hypothetical protein